MSDALLAETIMITGHNGDEIEAYSARALDEAPRGGVFVIHHMPGYDDQTKEIARNFAYHGYNAVVPNLYWREVPGASPDDAAATARANGGVPDARLGGGVPRDGRRPRRALGRRRRRRHGLPQGPGQLQRQGRRDRLLLGRPPVVP